MCMLISKLFMYAHTIRHGVMSWNESIGGIIEGTITVNHKFVIEGIYNAKKRKRSIPILTGDNYALLFPF